MTLSQTLNPSINKSDSEKDGKNALDMNIKMKKK